MQTPHIHRFGHGPRHLVGFHGWAGDRSTFFPLEPYRPDDVTLHAVELPGYGQTPSLDTWSIDTMCASVNAAFDAIDAPRLTFVGNCSGAILGLLGALEHHTRIERIVLVDPFAYVPWYFQLMLTPGGIGRMIYASSFANPLGRLITQASLRNNRAADTDMTGSFRRVNHHAAWWTLRVLGDIATIDRFAPVVAPTTVLYGRRSFAAIHRSIPLWQNIWPHAQAICLEQAGHLPIQEATAEVAHHVFGGERG